MVRIAIILSCYAFSNTSLYKADIFCWVEAYCRGAVPDNEKKSMAQKLSNEIRATKKTIDLAIYGLRMQDWLVDDLRYLKNRGVKIRVITDQQKGDIGDWYTRENFTYGDAYKIFELLGNDHIKVDINKDGTVRKGPIMHNKFIVIDNKRVWVGSTNISNTGIGSEYNANLSVMLENAELARQFGDEFNQMFKSGRFGIHKFGVKRKPVNFMGGTVQTFFAPQDDIISSAIVPMLEKANDNVDVGMFFLTSNRIADALIETAKRGVKIRIIHDATADRHPAAVTNRLRKNGIEVKVENWGGKMHMKTLIVDRKHFLVGSMNFSDAGNRKNDESVVVLWGIEELAIEAWQYFDELWDTLADVKNRPRAESRESINSCEDGVDNDHSGGIDENSKYCGSESK